ncbi:hypothetical protein Gotri_006731 [Gossypium trilobum]|uniref:Uncharacterized protein n=1 Tax=Gossypium trilobum TaxID=34281 RepID=A0A7J9FUX4_9ROSI|nr:hypothetical protein [Gossypium trilobum]
MDTTILTESTTGKFFNPFAFASQKVAVLVDDSNFLAWNQESLFGADGLPVENLAYAQYEQQNSSLCAWLLSTVSASLHNQLIGSSSSVFEFWCALVTPLTYIRHRNRVMKHY